MKTLFLVLASLITIISVIPYLIDIAKGNTRPNLVSWLTWTLLTGIATVAELVAGEYVSAIFTGAAVLETAAVVVLGLAKHAYVSYTKFDVWCQIGAIVGIILWFIFNDPVIAVVASVTIDFIGALPTVRHSWLEPNEETWQTYGLAALGGIFAIIALSTYNWISLSYAVYIVLINTILALIIVKQRIDIKNRASI